MQTALLLLLCAALVSQASAFYYYPTYYYRFYYYYPYYYYYYYYYYNYYSYGYQADKTGCADCQFLYPDAGPAAGVRLMQGPSGTLGLDENNEMQAVLQVNMTGTWKNVCGYYFDGYDAAAVCRQFGYESSTETLVGYVSELQTYSDMYANAQTWKSCAGTEDDYLSCPDYYYSGYCSDWYAVAVTCKGVEFVYSANETVRLANVGTTASHIAEGVLQLYKDGDWTNICDDGWGIGEAAAKVACEELGFDGGETISRYDLYDYDAYYSALAPIETAYVSCTGDESSLSECSSGTPYYCGSYEDVTLKCASVPTLAFSYPAAEHKAPSLRLMYAEGMNADTATEVQGILQVKVNQSWGSVCDDAFTTTDAIIACRELGYEHGVVSDGDAIGLDTTLYSSFHDYDIVMDDVECLGTELTLAACPSVTSSHNCLHSEDVVLTCGNWKGTDEEKGSCCCKYYSSGTQTGYTLASSCSAGQYYYGYNGDCPGEYGYTSEDTCYTQTECENAELVGGASALYNDDYGYGYVCSYASEHVPLVTTEAADVVTLTTQTTTAQTTTNANAGFNVNEPVQEATENANTAVIVAIIAVVLACGAIIAVIIIVLRRRDGVNTQPRARPISAAPATPRDVEMVAPSEKNEEGGSAAPPADDHQGSAI